MGPEFGAWIKLHAGVSFPAFRECRRPQQQQPAVAAHRAELEEEEPEVDLRQRDVLVPADTLIFSVLTLLWPMMSGTRQPSPWLKPYKTANSRKVRKLCRRPSNCEHFATRLRSTVSTPPILAEIYRALHVLP